MTSPTLGVRSSTRNGRGGNRRRCSAHSSSDATTPSNITGNDRFRRSEVLSPAAVADKVSPEAIPEAVMGPGRVVVPAVAGTGPRRGRVQDKVLIGKGLSARHRDRP